ncbi:MAG: efflux RND transporter periplasmic adaptor subunit [Gemmataceae bacterium]|nr:efflux RND transporter periplasmic adaptor subunit [Gemmataceae bacterium]
MRKFYPRDAYPSSRCSIALGRWLTLLAAGVIAGCGQTPAIKEKKVEVVVTTPIADDLVEFQDFTGRLDAYRTVDIRARVTGYVDSAPFKEGDRVTEGKVLFEIDPRTYQAQVDSAAADLATRKAEVQRADALYRRSMDLVRTKAATAEDVDKQRGDLEVARATVAQAEAKLRDAKLSREFCHVLSPISGRVSRRYVDPGNNIKADDTILTTVVADDKVHAYFDVDERTYLDLVGEGGSTSTAPFKDLKFPVLMRLANAEDFTHTGAVDFLDNRLSGSSGTIRMRAVFDNPRDTLRSGLFIRIRLPIGKPYHALLIPDEAIQSDQGRKYVYVVKTTMEEKADGSREEKDVVEYRLVTPGQSLKELREIKPAKQDAKGNVLEGLLEGERVVISGMQRVRAKTQVHAKDQAPLEPPGSPLRKLLNQTTPGNGLDKESGRKPVAKE